MLVRQVLARVEETGRLVATARSAVRLLQFIRHMAEDVVRVVRPQRRPPLAAVLVLQVQAAMPRLARAVRLARTVVSSEVQQTIQMLVLAGQAAADAVRQVLPVLSEDKR